MPTPARALTNDYKDCKLIKLDAADPTSPFVVMQEGYSPGDPNCRMRMYYLQHDGMWIDEISRSTLPDSDMGEIVFEKSADAMRCLSSLAGRPFVRELPVTENDVRNYMARAQSGTAEELFRQFLARYRAATGKT
jgi:hypothetical protein